MTDDGIVYHYCSLETLRSFFSSGCFWLSDLREGNDENERETFCKLYFEWLRRQGFVPGMARYEYENDIGRKKMYGACFTYNEDALLHWFGYGKDGVAVGFDKNKLIDWAGKIVVLQHKAKCHDVLYPENKGSIDSYFKEIHGLFKDEVYRELLEVEEASMFFKSFLWKEEREFRICFSNFIDEDFGHSGLPEVKFDGSDCAFDLDIKDGRSVSHYEVPGILDCVRSITIGAKRGPNASELKSVLAKARPEFDFRNVEMKESKFCMDIESLYGLNQEEDPEESRKAL